MNQTATQATNTAARRLELEQGTTTAVQGVDAFAPATKAALARIKSGDAGDGYVCEVYDNNGNWTTFQGETSLDVKLRTWPEGQTLSVNQQVLLMWIGSNPLPLIFV